MKHVAMLYLCNLGLLVSSRLVPFQSVNKIRRHKRVQRNKFKSIRCKPSAPLFFYLSLSPSCLHINVIESRGVFLKDVRLSAVHFFSLLLPPSLLNKQRKYLQSSLVHHRISLSLSPSLSSPMWCILLCRATFTWLDTTSFHFTLLYSTTSRTSCSLFNEIYTEVYRSC